MEHQELATEQQVTIASDADSEINFTWIERDDDDASRRGTMYCFKSCSVNQN